MQIVSDMTLLGAVGAGSLMHDTERLVHPIDPWGFGDLSAAWSAGGASGDWGGGGGASGDWREGTPALDGALSAALGRTSGVATTAFIDGAMTGAGYTRFAGPVGILGGAVVGGLIGWGANELLKKN